AVADGLDVPLRIRGVDLQNVMLTGRPDAGEPAEVVIVRRKDAPVFVGPKCGCVANVLFADHERSLLVGAPGGHASVGAGAALPFTILFNPTSEAAIYRVIHLGVWKKRVFHHEPEIPALLQWAPFSSLLLLLRRHRLGEFLRA